MFKTWDELTEEEQLLTEISDIFKDINGFRPRGILSGMGVPELRAYLETLYKESEVNFRLEQEAEVERIDTFEKSVKNTMKYCNCDRKDAIRYLMDAHNCKDDYGMFCYENGLPYNYLGIE